MGRLSLLALGVIGTLNLLGVSAQTAPACVETCTNDVRNKFADLQCPDASAAPCFCTNPAFSTAILQCSQAQCGGTVDNIYTYLSTHFCAGQALPPPNGAAVPSSSTSQIPTPSVTPTTPPTPTTTPTTIATEAITTSTNAVPTTPPAVTSASTESTTSGAATVETGSSTSSPPPSSTTSGSAASATSSGNAAGGSTSSGLSQAAIAGIGVGIGVVVLAVAGIVICMLLRGRKRKVGRAGDNMDISRPLPGSGRMYPEREATFRNDRDHSMEKFGNDLEMTSHRYEDMVPRTQPRNLV